MDLQDPCEDLDDWDRYPELVAEIGEDPTRWLDHDMLKQTLVRQEEARDDPHGGKRLVEDNRNNSTFGKMFKARVRGIDKLYVLRLWMEVESRLDRGPRDHVLDPLRERAQELRENGERSHYLPFGPQHDRDLPPVETPELDQRSADEMLATDGGRDGE